MIFPIHRRERNTQRPAVGRRVGPGRAGFMILDVLAALTILIIGFSAVVGSLVASQRLRDGSRETALAYEAARTQLEEMRAMSFQQVFASYNETSVDDPPGPGAAPGGGFTVPGLAPWDDDPDGFVGRITFPVVPGAPAALREDIENSALGMPRDLSADKAVDGGDHAADYILLPVQVLVEWQGPSGPRSIGVETLLAAR